MYSNIVEQWSLKFFHSNTNYFTKSLTNNCFSWPSDNWRLTSTRYNYECSLNELLPVASPCSPIWAPFPCPLLVSVVILLCAVGSRSKLDLQVWETVNQCRQQRFITTNEVHFIKRVEVGSGVQGPQSKSTLHKIIEIDLWEEFWALSLILVVNL